MECAESFPMAPSFEFRRSVFHRKCLSRCKINSFATFLTRLLLRTASSLPERDRILKLSHLATALLWVMILGSQANAESTDDLLLVYAVNIHRTPMQSWGPGYGIYLGKGLFITAAHVAGHTWFTRPKVAIAGTEYPTKVIKAGDFETIDVTLLSVDESLLPSRLALRRNPLSAKPPWPGEPVIPVAPEGTARSRKLAPKRLPRTVRNIS